MPRRPKCPSIATDALAGVLFSALAPVVKQVKAPEEVTDLVSLFCRIAGEEGWQPGGELTAYPDRSTYFGLWVNGTLVGGLQIVHPDPATGSLPCHKVWPEVSSCNASRVAHITVMAVDKAWRGKNGGLFWHLAVAMWRFCVDNHITDLFLEATPSTYRCYQRLGWPLSLCGPLRTHWGEPCLLTRLSVREVAGSLTERATRSPLYRRLLLQATEPSVATG